MTTGSVIQATTVLGVPRLGQSNGSTSNTFWRMRAHAERRSDAPMTPFLTASADGWRATAATVPAFLSVDVEPDGFQPAPRAIDPWSGFAAIYDVLAELRGRLAQRSGAWPAFGWYVRTDPQIEATFGRADAAFATFPDRFTALTREGDYFGVHAHPIRWSAAHACWVHDVAEPAWLRHVATSALEAFARATGARATRVRSGGGFLNDDLVGVFDAHGVQVELGFEPGASWGLTARQVATGVDTSPIVGAYVDSTDAPRTPYRPDRCDFRRRGGADGRGLTIVPVTTGPRRLPPRGLGLAVRRLLGRTPKPRSTRVLYPTADWPSDRYYWDLVAHRLDAMERPYLSLGLRTDAPGTAVMRTLVRRLRALVRHPLAARLRFVDPLAVVETLRSDAVAGDARCSTPV